MIAKFSVKRPFTVLVAVILVIILGVVAFSRMTPNLLPDIDLPYVIVATSYIGASPEEVESAVTKPVEQAMATLDDVKTIESVSSENYSIVMLEFATEANMDATTMNIREQLDVLSADWDDYVGVPVIMKINPNMLPLSAIAVGSEGMDQTELSRFYETSIEPRLEGVEGVANVTASGLIKEKINVVLRQDRMDALNVSICGGVDREFADSEKKLDDAQEELDEGEDEIDENEKKLDKGKGKLSTTKKQLNTQSQQLDDGSEKLNAAEKTILDTISDLESRRGDAEAALSARPGMAAQAQAAVDAIAGQISAAEAQKAALDPSAADYAEQAAGCDAAIASLNAAKADAEAARDAIPSEASLNGAIAQLNAGINAAKAKLNEVQEQYRQVVEGAEKIAEAQAGVNYASEQMKKGEEALDDAKEEVSSAQQQIDDAREELQDAKEQTYDATDLNNLLSLQTVGGILGAENFSMPAGYAVDPDGDAEWLVYVGDKLQSEAELRELVLFDLELDGVAPIKLSDVADIFVSDNSGTTYAKINGENGVLLSFNKQSGYATATVSKDLHAAFSQLEAEYPGLHFDALMDQGEYIEVVIGSVLENIVLGAVLAILILLLFLWDVRPTFVIACSIPISVTFAIVLMYFSGVTLNVISMAGLAVGVGMLVDNSIVVIENIYRLRRAGVSAVKAAISGAVQMTGAITASTLTTVCVFVPILFVEGITRQLFSDMALTIAYSLLASLAVALTLVPALSSGTLRRTRQKPAGRESAILRGYTGAVRFTLRFKALAFLVCIILLTVSLYTALGKGFTYLPDMDSPQMTVQITLPEETTFDEAAQVTDEVAARIRTLPEVQTVGTMFSAGMASMFGISSDAAEDTTATMAYVVLKTQDSFLGYVPKERRQRSSVELGPVIEALCADLDCTVDAAGAGNMAEYMDALGGSGVTINLFGSDLDALRETAGAIAEKLASMPGVKNVSDGVEETTPALRITVDKEKAMLRGLTVAQVYQNIATALTADATATTIEDTDSDIVIRMQEDDPTIHDVRERVLTFTDRQGKYQKVALSEIATFSESETLQSISRSGQRRYVTVTGEVADGYNVTLVTAQAQRLLLCERLPEGMSMEFAGENETIMSAMEDLLLMLALAIVIVYLIMVAQFQSLLSPLIVMVTIPLAFTGGLLALLACGMEVSIVALIGFVMLVGIIVNNGIVLIDTTNQLRIEGMERRAAIVAACSTRIRPVLMTALTTILGLIPLSLGLGVGGGLVQPIAVVCIGGLVYATFMTLFIVPALYDLLVKREPRNIGKADLEILRASDEAALLPQETAESASAAGPEEAPAQEETKVE